VISAEAALEVNPDDPKVLSLVGGIFTDIKNYDKAVEHLERAVEMDPESSDTVFNLANAYLGQGSLDKAAELFVRSLEANPDDHQALYQLGSIYDQSKKFDEAIDAFLKVVDLKPKFARGWDALYKAYAHKSAVTEGAEAREAAKKAEEALNRATALGGE
jgi:tetratricopeptide (TPR) repeat protein